MSIKKGPRSALRALRALAPPRYHDVDRKLPSDSNASAPRPHQHRNHSYKKPHRTTTVDGGMGLNRSLDEVSTLIGAF
ncbi:hypothetical protein [Haloparvum sedimenti]|uniref:hypothetical protein n=1 Tax=Haloparvum sedimenti TaxID=1678448 RepID=UPI001C401008|nr:hypothetical protein [Haloparvum sedimenti]